MRPGQNWDSCLPASNKPPVCTDVKPNVTALWPPNHQFVPVKLSGATDPDGVPVTIAVGGVTQDEPLNSTGDGRVYRVAFTVDDGKGGTCTGSAKVTVPKSQGRDGGFLLRDGFDQIRQVFAAVTANPRLDLYAKKAA